MMWVWNWQWKRWKGASTHSPPLHTIISNPSSPKKSSHNYFYLLPCRIQPLSPWLWLTKIIYEQVWKIIPERVTDAKDRSLLKDPKRDTNSFSRWNARSIRSRIMRNSIRVKYNHIHWLSPINMVIRKVTIKVFYTPLWWNSVQKTIKSCLIPRKSNRKKVVIFSNYRNRVAK